MKSSPRRSVLRALVLGCLAVQAGIDRMTGRPLPLGLGVDAPVTAATAAATTPETTPAAPAAAAAPAAVAAPTLGSVIKGAFASLGDKAKLGTDLAQARAELATRTTELATRTTERDTAQQQLAAAQNQLSAFAGFFGLKSTEIAGKDATALREILAQKISESATEQLAVACVPAAQLPKANQAEARAPGELLAEYNKITDATARAAFYEKNKDKMFTSN